MSGAVLPGDRFIDAVDWFPDEQLRRQALEAAFDQIDEDDSASLDPFELQKAGFDAKLVMEKLDSNRDGSLSREEFVDQMLSLASNELTLSAWELENLLEAQRRNSLVTKGKRSVWGSRTIRRAVETPKFELVSLVALLAVSLSYAIGIVGVARRDRALLAHSGGRLHLGILRRGVPIAMVGHLLFEEGRRSAYIHHRLPLLCAAPSSGWP